MILHLVSAAVWDAVPVGGSYAPPSLATEGFVHCTGDDAVLLQVANAFYRELGGDVVALSLDEAKLTSETRWEPPAHINADGPQPAAGLFPHVFGPLERDAVVLERRFTRAADGRYMGFEPG